MRYADGWLERALQYRPVLEEYCDLATCPLLDDGPADRLAAILQQAETDPLLSWLLEEADHLLAHLQGLVGDEKIQQQQQQLQAVSDEICFNDFKSAMFQGPGNHHPKQVITSVP
jgi:hypothetical protein